MKKKYEKPTAIDPDRLNKLKAMTEDEIEAAASSDPDNLPLDDENIKKTIPVINPVKIRKKLRMTQAQFAEVYNFNLRTLQDWEQGRFIPDRSSLLILNMIYHHPEEVKRMLEDSFVAST